MSLHFCSILFFLSCWFSHVCAIIFLHLIRFDLNFWMVVNCWCVFYALGEMNTLHALTQTWAYRADTENCRKTEIHTEKEVETKRKKGKKKKKIVLQQNTVLHLAIGCEETLNRFFRFYYFFGTSFAVIFFFKFEQNKKVTTNHTCYSLINQATKDNSGDDDDDDGSCDNNNKNNRSN